jgi:hypothetical protein
MLWSFNVGSDSAIGLYIQDHYVNDSQTKAAMLYQPILLHPNFLVSPQIDTN